MVPICKATLFILFRQIALEEFETALCILHDTDALAICCIDNLISFADLLDHLDPFKSQLTS